MSFTRFYDDPIRIVKQVEQSSFAGKYALNVPGPGDVLPYIQDPQMRLQKWGGNGMNNMVNLESDLRGMTRKMNRDSIGENDYKLFATGGVSNQYPASNITFVNESRATHPAWEYRSIQQDRWEKPWLNPQANIEKRFHDNIQTRILEKDYNVPVIQKFAYL